MATKRETHGSADYQAVTPSDVTDIRNGELCRALYIGGAGNVAAVRPDGTAVVFSNLPAGAFMAVQCLRVNNTGTTATNIVALF